MSFFMAAVERHATVFSRVSELEPDVMLLADDIMECIARRGKIIFMGNGGSAADCQHLAAEFVVRYKEERDPVAAMALTVDSSILTAHANDYDYSTVFSRQMRALCKPEDVVIGISTSGNSLNVIDAFQYATAAGARCWGWTNETGGKMSELGLNLIKVPALETARVQEVHLFIGHWLCEEVDRRMTQA